MTPLGRYDPAQLGDGEAELLVGGELVSDGDTDGDGDGLCDGDGDGDGDLDGEVGVGAGGLLRDGADRLGDADGDSDSDGEGAAESDGDGESRLEPVALSMPDNEVSSVPSEVLSPSLWAVGARSAGASSSALTTAIAVPMPPAMSAVSTPAAITSRRVGRPRRVLRRPRSYPIERTAPAASRHNVCQRLTSIPFRRRTEGWVGDPALSSFRPAPARARPGRSGERTGGR